MKVTREAIDSDKAKLITFVVNALFWTWLYLGDRELITSLPLSGACLIYLTIIFFYNMTLKVWVEAFREIEFDAEGVNVRLWKYSKKYCWEELKEKNWQELNGMRTKKL